MSQNYRKQVQLLVEKPENVQCSDCLLKGKNEWASINLGVFMCTECSGVHRNLGSHISKVKSIILDEWDKTTYESMLIGNEELNKKYEPYIFSFEKPTENDPPIWRKKFLIDKYVNKKFQQKREFDKSWAQKSGYLTKEGSIWKTWKKRYFTIEGNTLKYYGSEKVKKESGAFVLEKDLEISTLYENEKAKKNCFQLKTQNKCLILSASTEEEELEWIFAIKVVLYSL